MSNQWSREQVDALAPDAKSLKAAQKLMSPAKWPSLGANDVALWGECQGSGKKPYLTRIDLSEPAFKCSCPSRKFPCKHALALFHLYVDDGSSFSASSAPEWVTEWLASRQARQETKAQKADAPIDAKAQAKRSANREQKIEAGLAELSLWIHDLVRAGLAQIPDKPHGYVDEMAARLIDAQAPGLARRVRSLSTQINSGGLSTHQSEWTSQLAQALGQLQLILAAYQRQDQLPDGVRADVRRVVGWTDNQQEVLQQQGLIDEWLVLAQQHTQEERLRVRKNWLWGKDSGQIGLILEFAHGSTPFQTTLTPGKKWGGEVVFFNSNFPQRAAVKSQEVAVNVTHADMDLAAAYPDFDAMLAGYAAALAKNCWLEDFPALLRQITPMMSADRLLLLDQDGTTVPIHPSFHHGELAKSWQLLAISGGHPIDLIADWNGEFLQPLAVWHEGFIQLGDSS